MLIDILMVDDRPENLLSLESILEAPELRLIRALSGEEALEAALNSRPALILLDVQMPGMDGFEVARTLRSNQRTRDIPIIFVTATHREEKFTFQGFESGAVDYLFKPLNPVIVKSKVNIFVELHRNRISLEHAVEEASRVNKELESFSYTVSHDLRAPVRAILGFAQMAIEQLEGKDDQVRADLGRIVSAGQRMNRLIEGLLDLSHVTRASMKSEKVDLSALASQVLADLATENKDRKVSISVQKGLIATGDPRLLESMFRNLIGNSWKFTSRTSSAQIEFGMKKEGDKSIYFIKDNGAGFDMAQNSKLFGVFQRLHSEEKFQGTGIGLATTKRIIERHNGTIWAEGIPDAGATFYFTL